MRVGAWMALVLFAGGCGAAPASQIETRSPPAQEPAVGVYRGVGTVLEDETHGPMLCFTVADSLPPQCGDVPLERWNWSAVEGEETIGKTTWGDGYVVTGRYDGEVLLVTNVERRSAPVTAPHPLEGLSSPCVEPSGGWPVPAEASWPEAAGRYARSRPEYAGSWVTSAPRPTRGGVDEPVYVLTVVFTARAATYEAEMRNRWTGPLCVVERQVPTRNELDQVSDEVEVELEAMGVHWVSLSVNEVAASVDVGVVADPGRRAQATFDELYGPGIVRVTPHLVPVR